MNYLGNSRKVKRKKKSHIPQIILIIIAMVISIYLLTLIKLPIISNISSAVVNFIDVISSTISGVVTEGTSYFANSKKLSEENEELKKQVEDLKFKLRDMESLEVENSDLKEKLDIDSKYKHYDKVYADVILRDYDNWNESFTINKGSEDGIKEKQTVISSSGLVGYISTVGANTAVVCTILNPNTSVSVEISTINALALLKGDFELKSDGMLKLTNMPIDVDLSSGEKIYTAGIGMMYKKGIIIGEIKEVVNKKNEVDRYAVIKPYTNFESLDTVAVIVD